MQAAGRVPGVTHGDRGRGQPPVDAIGIAHPEHGGPLAAADVSREPEFPAVRGPRADRHAEQVVEPMGGQQALEDRRMADERDGVVDDQQPAEIRVSAEIGQQCADRPVSVRRRAGRTGAAPRPSFLAPGDTATSRRRRFSAIGDSRPLNFWSSAAGRVSAQNARICAARERWPAACCFIMSSRHSIWPSARSRIDQVQAVRELRPAVQAIGQLAQQLRAEPLVDVVVVERPQLVGAQQAAPGGCLAERRSASGTA